MTQSTEDTLLRLAAVIDSRKGGDPDQSYVSRLFHKGDDAVLKKIGEEATEVVLAGRVQSDERLAEETADLFYHLLVALHQRKVPLARVMDELRRRRSSSGARGSGR